MQFITSGDRIAVENFTLGDLYTITFTNGNYINSACIGIGGNFVTFQRNEPELLFSLTMETAELVSSIDLYAGGSGTTNYNELSNKPQIGGVELVGNKSLSDLGIQATISDIDTIRSGAAAGATAVQPAALADYQPIISDLDTIRSGAAAGATAVQPAALADYQPIIDSSHKLDADLVDDTSSTHKFATAAQLSQIETNKNNISSKIVYGTCSTAAATAAKVVDVPSGFVLTTGCIVAVFWTVGNTASNITLNVGGTGAIEIAYNSYRPYTSSSSKVTGSKNMIFYYMYDGTYWVYITLSQVYNALPQSEADTGTSTTERYISAKVLNDTILDKADQAPLTGYTVDTAESSIVATTTVQEAVEQLDYRTATNKNNISTLLTAYNTLGAVIRTIDLSTLNFTKSGGGLYYSDKIDYSAYMDYIYAVTLTDFGGVSNIAINFMLDGLKVSLVVCDPQAPQSNPTYTGTITVKLFGYKK